MKLHKKQRLVPGSPNTTALLNNDMLEEHVSGLSSLEDLSIPMRILPAFLRDTMNRTTTLEEIVAIR
jgi:hypothetical protein